MRKILVYLLLLLPAGLLAQKKDKNAVKAAATITPADMQKHLYIIASKEMEGRNTPSAGLDRAADYIAAQFQAMGLKPGNNGSYKQVYPLYRDSANSASLTINGSPAELNGSFQPLQGSFSATLRFSELVFAGFGISDGEGRDDYKDLNLAGKLVMIFDETPEGYKPPRQGRNSPASTYARVNAAAAKGAIGVLVIQSGFPRKANAATASPWSPQGGFRATQTPVAFSISPELAAKIAGTDAAGWTAAARKGEYNGKVYATEVELAFLKNTQTNAAANVVAVLEGTDKKDEYLVITGHYDHLGKRDSLIYYGADDDGSGTTGVLEIAEAFAKAKAEGKGPRRSIVFMTVSGEEKGLWGSAYYTDHPLFPLEKTTANLNIDMIGRTDASRKTGDSSNYVYVVGDDKISTDLKTISEGANKLYTKMELDYKFNDPKDPNRIYFRSDHYNFARKGVPIIFYYDGMLGADYHRPTDTPDKINYVLMAKRAQLVFYTAWEMANREEMLKRDLKLEVPERN